MSLLFVASDDGKLVVLAGVDNRKLPEHGFLGDPVNAGWYGLVTLDIFDSSPKNHIAAVDLDSRINVNAARARVTLINSRWLAIGLTGDFRKMFLFGFRGVRAETQ